jgi:hypothetical protein
MLVRFILRTSLKILTQKNREAAEHTECLLRFNQLIKEI